MSSMNPPSGLHGEGSNESSDAADEEPVERQQCPEEEQPAPAAERKAKQPKSARNPLKTKYKKAPDAPKRFKSAFIFFSMEKHKELRANSSKDGETNKKTTRVAKQVSEAWKGLSADEREVWEEMARKDKARYDAERATYKGPWKVLASKRAPKDPDAPKRPMSAFLAFSNSRRLAVKRANKSASNGEISKILSRMWQEADPDLKKKYADEEAKLRAEYKLAIAEWRAKEGERKKAERKNREDLAMKSIDKKGASMMRGGVDAIVDAQGESGMAMLRRQQQQHRRNPPPRSSNLSNKMVNNSAQNLNSPNLSSQTTSQSELMQQMMSFRNSTNGGGKPMDALLAGVAAGAAAADGGTMGMNRLQQGMNFGGNGGIPPQLRQPNNMMGGAGGLGNFFGLPGFAAAGGAPGGGFSGASGMMDGQMPSMAAGVGGGFGSSFPMMGGSQSSMFPPQTNSSEGGGIPSQFRQGGGMFSSLFGGDHQQQGTTMQMQQQQQQQQEGRMGGPSQPQELPNQQFMGGGGFGVGGGSALSEQNFASSLMAQGGGMPMMGMGFGMGGPFSGGGGMDSMMPHPNNKLNFEQGGEQAQGTRKGGEELSEGDPHDHFMKNQPTDL